MVSSSGTSLLILVGRHDRSSQTSSNMYFSCLGLVICSALLRFIIAAVLGGVPLIGPVPEVEGLMLATGHEGSGLCMVCFLSNSFCKHFMCIYSMHLS